MELAPEYSIRRVEDLLNSNGSKRARTSLVKFIRVRHKNRFFDPITHLGKIQGGHVGYGFAMMSLCSLLVETIQCYKTGLPTTDRREFQKLAGTPGVPPWASLNGIQPMSGSSSFEDFFVGYSTSFNGLAGGEFHRNIRNGLLHQSQTKNGWRINKKGSKVWDPNKKTVNRTLFAEALQNCFDNYLSQLDTAVWTDPVWVNARRKIWWLCYISK